MFALFGAGVLLTLLVGFYCVLTTRNLVRALIGIEILTKAVTLLLILCGHLAGRIALAQTLAITLIVIEVVVMVVAVGIVLCVFRHNQTIDVATLRDLKG
jgi:NADH-quinone oxidoreductase subunit K